MKKVLIVDDHSLVRVGITFIILKEFPDALVTEAENEKECLVKLKSTAFDLVILDLNMPDSDSFRIVHHIHNNYPSTKTLVITMTREEVSAMRYFQAGISGFINKGCSNEDIASAIKMVLNGKIYISNSLMQVWAEKQIQKKMGNPFDALSNREFQIAFELINGKTMLQISEHLGISVSTVSTYKSKLYEKLSIPMNNLAQLIDFAKQYHL